MNTSLLQAVRLLPLLALGAFMAAPARAADPAVAVKVYPRIGLFNEFQYVRSAGDRPPPAIAPQAATWKPLDRAQFQASVHETLQNLLANTVGSEWELLTTQRPEAAYGSRRVRITLAAASGSKVAGCRVAAGAHHAAASGHADDTGKCAVDLELKSNLETKVSVLWRGAAPSEEKTAQAEVPADFLILIAGDSYASGEGNPDRPCRQTAGLWQHLKRVVVGCEQVPLWMDERCHRSMWAAGMRSALRLIREDNGPVKRHGAYTVVNLACSGASLATGLNSTYKGVKSLEEFRAAHPELGLAEKIPTLPEDIPAQMGVASRLIASERDRGGKREADLVILSAGGNDMQFGDIAESSIKAKLTPEWLGEIMASLHRRLTDYQASLQTFADRLAGLPAAQYVLALYPDVTGLSNPDELSLRCSDGALASFRDFGQGLFAISNEERALAYKALVVGLNQVNIDFAGRQRIKVLDRKVIDSEFAKGGWCAGPAGESVYERGLRLIRKADESMAYQGNVNGTMHPTFQGHEVIAGQITEAISQSHRSVVKIRLPNEFKVAGSNKLYVPSPLRVAAYESDTERESPHEVCVGEPRSDFGNCASGVASAEFPDGHLVQTTVTGIHQGSKRRFRHAVSERVVDRVAPEIAACRAHRPAGGPPRACDQGWLGGDDVLVFTASDGDGSGVSRIRLSTPQGATETLIAETTPAQPGELALKASQLKGGRIELRVSAYDQVGNRAQKSQWVAVDNTAPELQVAAYDYLRSADDTRQVPAPGGVVELTVRSRDAESGVVQASYQFGEGREAPLNVDDLASRFEGCVAFAQDMAELASVVRITSVEAAPLKVFARNCARRRADAPPMTLLRIPVRNTAPLAARQWAAQPAAVAGLKNAVSRMTRMFPMRPSADDPVEFAVFAVWLNLADGRLSPALPVNLQVDPAACTAQEGGSASLYAVLMKADDCLRAAGGEPERRESLLRTLSRLLEGSAALPRQ